MQVAERHDVHFMSIPKATAKAFKNSRPDFGRISPMFGTVQFGLGTVYSALACIPHVARESNPQIHEHTRTVQLELQFDTPFEMPVSVNCATVH
jgi:hypothetical protein